MSHAAPLKAVLFDLDGTLLDTAPDFERTLNHLLASKNRPAISATAIRQTVSHGGRALVQLGFGISEGEPGFDELLAEFLALYQQNLLIGTRLFPGLDQTLALIEQQGLQWGIVTNKPSLYTAPILQGLDLAERCAAAICPEHTQERKPSPEGILLACKLMGCEPQQACYVGDHLRDIQAGKNAGMETLAATYGYIADDDPVENWGADHLVGSAADINAYIAQRLEHKP